MRTHPDATAPWHLVYVSQAAPDLAPDAFASICRRARGHNAAAGIGGVLLYDGQWFGQWLCGPQAATAALMQRIAVDARHHGVTVLFAGQHSAHRSPQPWRSGYAQPEALPSLAASAATPHVDMLHAFRLLIPTADLWPPLG